MKTHICYFLIILFTVISLPLYATNANEVTEMVPTQELNVVDINKADVETLSLLNGVGAKRAKAIVVYRELHGDFNTIDDLLNVKGIGQSVLEKNKRIIKL